MDDFRNGYLNVISNGEYQPTENSSLEIAFGHYGNLNPIVEDESVEEILFSPPLNIMPPDAMVECFKHWHKKLDKNGKIGVYFIDIRYIGRFAHTGEMSLLNLHNFIFGNNYSFRSILDLDTFYSFVKACGFYVETMSNDRGFVSAEIIKC